MDELTDKQSSAAVAASKITFRAYAKPLNVKLPDGTPLGDHTWVSTDQKETCWSCLGGGDESYYCGPNRWSSGKYKPPGGSRKLPESGKETAKAATCMGKPKRKTYKKIQTSAGIVYAVHGVCHEISNRVLFYSGATVRGAKQYNVTKILYGTYGMSMSVQK